MSPIYEPDIIYAQTPNCLLTRNEKQFYLKKKALRLFQEISFHQFTTFRFLVNLYFMFDFRIEILAVYNNWRRKVFLFSLLPWDLDIQRERIKKFKSQKRCKKYSFTMKKNLKYLAREHNFFL